MIDDSYQDEINWDKVGGVPAAGTYGLEVVEATATATKKKQPMVKVRFEIKNTYDPAHEEFVTRNIFENFVLTREAGFRAKEFADAAGIDMPGVVNRDSLEEWAQLILGRKVDATLFHKDFEGRPQAKIKSYWPEGQAKVSGPATSAAAEADGGGDRRDRRQTNGGGAKANGSNGANGARQAQAPAGQTRSLREGAAAQKPSRRR
jgi:hypothetical protein